MWKALGNMQHPVLLLVEKLLWRAIFSVARGETGQAALTTFLASVPWERLDILKTQDRQWFYAGKRVKQCRPCLCLHSSLADKQDMKHLENLDNIDVAGDIPLGWPLTLIDNQIVHRPLQCPQSKIFFLSVQHL